MQIEQTGKQVVHQLAGRLRIGGVWYGRGDDVSLDAADAEVYASRHLSSPSRPGAVPKNVTPRKEPEREVLKASQVPLQAKSEEEAPVPAKTEEDASKARTHVPARKAR